MVDSRTNVFVMMYFRTPAWYDDEIRPDMTANRGAVRLAAVTHQQNEIMCLFELAGTCFRKLNALRY